MNGHLQPNLVDLCAATAGLDDKVLPISQHKEMHLSCFLAVINSLLTSGGKILILPKKLHGSTENTEAILEFSPAQQGPPAMKLVMVKIS